MDIKNMVSQTSSKLFEKSSDTYYPDVKKIAGIIDMLKTAIFPGFFNDLRQTPLSNTWYQALLTNIHGELAEEIQIVSSKQKAEKDAVAVANEIATGFLKELVNIQQFLYKDAQAGFDGDPAARSVDEVILTYPGLFAVFVYRISHSLFSANVPLIPRIMSEHAHSVTGIDIHPGAKIGEYFFIDHGTGVVIGETSVSGNHVKLYQGVTLGALSTKSGQKLAGEKRHPTIEDNVTIYSGATILGGATVIGKNTTIGGNAFITKSVPEDTKVIL